jgi:hypothetical protein
LKELVAEATAPAPELKIELAVVVELATEVESGRKTVLLGSTDDVVEVVLAGPEELVVAPKNPRLRVKWTWKYGDH